MNPKKDKPDKPDRRADRSQIEEAWRHVDAICAKHEGLLILRDALAISKDAYAEMEALSKEVGEHIAAAEEAAKKRRDAEGRLASLEQRLAAETEKMRNQMVRELEQRNASLVAEEATIKGNILKAKTECEALKQKLGQDIQERQGELNQLNKEVSDLQREKEKIARSIEGIRRGLPATA